VCVVSLSLSLSISLCVCVCVCARARAFHCVSVVCILEQNKARRALLLHGNGDYMFEGSRLKAAQWRALR